MAVNTTKIGAGELTIGAVDSLTNFTSQVTACRLVPSVDQGDAIIVLSGEQVAGDRTETFTLEGTLLQDLGATESTTEWLFENRGETFPFSFTPNTSKGKTVSGSLVVEAVDIGGEVGTKATSDFTFSVVGFPAIVPVTVTP